MADKSFFRRGRASSRPSSGSGSKERKKRKRWTSSQTKESTGTMRSVFKFSERNVNRPLIRAGSVEAIVGKIDAFPDAHTGVAKQQQDVGGQIIAAEQFLLD